jgi:drug/metabolite transporter (DMT)-like permease
MHVEKAMSEVGSLRRHGMMLAAATAVISGFAVFINGYGVRAWKGIADPTTYTTFKNLIAALVLMAIGIMATRRRSSEGLTRPRSATQWFGLAAVAVVGGSVAFALFFTGLARASSAQAAFLHKTLLIWVGILAVGFLREKVQPMHVVAVVLLLGGQFVLVGGLNELSFGIGEAMILGATLLWSTEIIITKKLLRSMSSITVGVARMAGGAALLIMWGFVGGGLPAMGALGLAQLGWVFITGAVLAGYVGTWYAALARAPALDVTAVLVGGAVLTALLKYAVSGTALPPALGLGLVAVGSAVAVVAGLTRKDPDVVAVK